MGEGIYDLNGWDIYGSNGWGSYGKELLFMGDILKKTDFQRSSLSGHFMTTGFGTFELLTCGLLQKWQDHSPP